MEEDAKKKKRRKRKKENSVNHDVKARILWFYLRIAFIPANGQEI